MNEAKVLDQIFVGHRDHKAVVLEVWFGKTATAVALTPDEAVKVAGRLLSMAELVTYEDISGAWVVGRKESE